MTPSEAARLLKMVSAGDGRSVTEETAANWAWQLDDVSIQDGFDAYREHTRGDDRHKFFTPAHIRDYMDAKAKTAVAFEEGLVKTARGLNLIPDSQWRKDGIGVVLRDDQRRAALAWRDGDVKWREQIEAKYESDEDRGPIDPGYGPKGIR